MHIELLSATATAPSTGAAGAAISGDSLTVKNGNGRCRILHAWGKNQTAGFSQIAYPSGHDTTRNIRAGVSAGFNLGIIPLGFPVTVQPQELLGITIAGSATAGDVEQLCMLMRYDDLPGINQRLLTADQVESRMETLVTIEHSAVTTAGPSYGTPTAITTAADLLRANRDYAILGCTTRTSCMAAYVIGPDTGNLRIGVPGDISHSEIGSQYFPLMSRVSGLACVPVINSGNKASTFFHATADENAGTYLCTWYLALLK